MSNVARTRVRTGASVVVVLAAFACGEPTSPNPTALPMPAFARKAASLDRPLAARSHPLEPERSTARIGSAGGTISLARAGLSLVVPPGALARTVTISVRTNSRDLVSYAFSPHGLVFAKPVEVLQATGGIRGAAADGSVGGYLAHGRLDVDDGLGHFAQLFPTHGGGGAVGFYITHFSGYALASGLDVAPGLDR